MDTAASNPILNGAFSQALQSLSSDALKPNSPRSIHPRTTDMISDLGLRYPPAAGKDEEGRAGLLMLLAEDVADVHPDLLGMAIREWVRTKGFMPKASELRNLSETMRHAFEVSQRNRLPAPQAEADEPRPSPAFNREELQRIVDAPASSISGSIFAMGLKGGYIEDLGGGRYREAGGVFTVVRSGPKAAAA